MKKMGKANCFNPRLSVLSDLESSEKDEDRIPAVGSQDEKKKRKEIKLDLVCTQLPIRTTVSESEEEGSKRKKENNMRKKRIWF